MINRRHINRLKWGYLLLAPVIISVAASVQVGRYACTAELETAAQVGSLNEVNFICSNFLGERPKLPVPQNAQIASPTDLASLRITVVGTLVATLFGVIALLAGYKAFIADEAPSSVLAGVACALEVLPNGLGVEAHFQNCGPTALGVSNLILTDDTGRVLLRPLPKSLSAGEIVKLEVLPPYSIAPSKIVIEGKLERSLAASMKFHAEFELASAGLGPLICTVERI